MANEPSKTETPATPPKKGKLIPILGGVVVLLIGSGAGYWFLMRPAQAAGEAHEAVAPAPTGIITFEPFVVNLADGGGSRFLKVNIQLVVADEAVAAHVQEEKVLVMRMRSAVLDLLAEQVSSELVTAEGKAALKASIAERVSKILEHETVSDVLFADFIVQF